MSRGWFRRFPYPSLVLGVHLKAVKDFYRAETDGLSVPGSTPAIALVRLLQTVARDLEYDYARTK